MTLKDFIRSVAVKFGLTQTMWSGDFKSWEIALQESVGYSSAEIIEKVKKATLKVKNGQAIYERDSVLFDEIDYSWPLLSALMWVSVQKQGSLKVIDFGGSLGSTYFQNKKFLDELHHVEWNIIEQENFVMAGRECIENDIIQFFYSVNECTREKGRPDILILSCTLPYIERPYELMEELLGHKIPHIIIDNTFFNYENRDRITIQKVPPSIYTASYPCWFLSYEKIKSIITENYTIVTEHKNDSKIILDGRSIQYRGFLAKMI